MINIKKRNIVKQLAEKFSNAKSVILADYGGFSVQEMNELRGKFRESEIEFRIIKNTLSKIALKKAKIEGLEKYLVGQTSAAFSYAEPILPARILKKFNINGKTLKIKAGYVEGEVFGFDEIIQLADLPPREELIANLTRYIANPLINFVRVLKNPIVGLLNQLNMIAESKKVKK